MFVALLREILYNAIKNLDTGQTRLTGCLERFRDVLIVDTTIISLYQDARDVYTLDDDRAGAKLHPTESLSTGLPARTPTKGAATHWGVDIWRFYPVRSWLPRFLAVQPH